MPIVHTHEKTIDTQNRLFLSLKCTAGHLISSICAPCGDISWVIPGILIITLRHPDLSVSTPVSSPKVENMIQSYSLGEKLAAVHKLSFSFNLCERRWECLRGNPWAKKVISPLTSVTGEWSNFWSNSHAKVISPLIGYLCERRWERLWSNLYSKMISSLILNLCERRDVSTYGMISPLTLNLCNTPVTNEGIFWRSAALRHGHQRLQPNHLHEKLIKWRTPNLILFVASQYPHLMCYKIRSPKASRRNFSTDICPIWYDREPHNSLSTWAYKIRSPGASKHSQPRSHKISSAHGPTTPAAQVPHKIISSCGLQNPQPVNMCAYKTHSLPIVSARRSTRL